MQIFGLVGLLITIALAAMWLTSAGGPVATEVDDNAEETKSIYGGALDSALEAADSMGSSASVSSYSVFVYDNISVPDDIRILDLSDRSLNGSLKAEVRHLTSLRELNLSNNNFTGLPAEVGQLSQLEVLNLSHNPFTGLPYELGNLKKLKVLDLRGTQYAEQDLVVITSSLPSTVQILTD